MYGAPKPRRTLGEDLSNDCNDWSQVAVFDLVGNVQGLDLSIEFFGLCHIRRILVDHDVVELRQVDLD